MFASVCVRALVCACCVAATCPPCPPPPAGRACTSLGSATADECFYHIVNITDNFYYSTAPGYFGLKCVPGLTLDEPALPRASGLVTGRVVLEGCKLPARAALAEALGVAPLDSLLLLQLPLTSPPRRQHFRSLGTLRRLHVTFARRAHIQDDDVFAPLIGLKELRLERVSFPAATLERLNATLESLELIECGLVTLSVCPPRLLVRDMALQTLLLPRPCHLTALTLAAPNLRSLPPIHSLLELSLKVKDVVALEGCGNLRNLSVSLLEARALPPRWLAACGALRTLRLSLPRVDALSPHTLEGLVSLSALSLDTGRSLTALPPRFFLHTRNISTLILNRNNFTDLQPDLFAPLCSLRVLSLSHNSLPDTALEALQGLPLRQLSLAHNPLGDLCPHTGNLFIDRQRSMLASLTELEELSLQNTGATRVCEDWRHLPRLRALDLRANNISELWWEDLKWRAREQRTEVLLSGNPLQGISISEAEYQSAVSSSGSAMVKLILDEQSPLRCDCHMYWFAKALQRGAAPVRFEGLRCAAPPHTGSDSGGDDAELWLNSLPIERVPPRDMECPLEGVCPGNCSCAASPARRGAVVRCGGVRRALPDLTALAQGLQESDRLVLEARNVGLTRLPPSLPRVLRQLDLRDNQLSALEPALFASGRQVLLSHNPLLCACGDAAFRGLGDHLDQVIDRDSVTCADGRPLVEARAACLGAGPSGWVWGAAGAALALLAVVVSGLVARRALTLRLKAFLLSRGLCLRWASPQDDDDVYKYDAFVSYAHADSDFALELVSALEGWGLRLCVHHRDWQPGAWIPAQIVESVCTSRRTIVLLSERFTASRWARAEFREAYARAQRDSALRLIVVLLEEAPPPGLDPEMHHYVTNNTYLRWDDPAFWQKLRVVLPAHRARRKRRPSPSPAPASDNAPPPAPPTPVVKFAEMQFPTPNKPLQQDTSPCA